MPTLPPPMRPVLAPFAPHVSQRVWSHAQVVILGAILAPARRTVAAALRVMGLDQSHPPTWRYRVRRRPHLVVVPGCNTSRHRCHALVRRDCHGSGS
jgi:hypothetical protein